MAKEREKVLFGETAADDWEFDVWLMARRMALLYHYMAEAIVKRLGEEEGRKLVKDAVWQYGSHCGNAVREAVLKKGLEPTLENFRTVPDLPSRGWRSGTVTTSDGKEKRAGVLCPLARTWKELSEDTGLARLYCFVDQSKIEGYNGCAYECVHAHNVLDGDDYCEVIFRPKTVEKEDDNGR